MKICILDDSYEQSDSILGKYDLPCDPSPYLEGHECHHVFLVKSKAVQQLIELSRGGYDVYINLCDGAWDEDRPGIEVVQTLERLGQAYTGANPAFYEPSREAMKRVCHYWGIPTPAYAFASDSAGVERAAARLCFPLLVKHPSSYSSIGMTRESRVEEVAALHGQAAIMIEQFGAALIEEFVEGREFTVLVAENPDDPLHPTAYQPVEFRFPEGESFKHFEMKWVEFHDMACVPCRDPELDARLREISRLFFLGLNGVSYGRCDIRLNPAGELFMLEINPNCGLFYREKDAGSADFVLLNDPAGHRGFLDQILRAAFKRRDSRQRKWAVEWTPDRGYASFCTRPIEAGEVVQQGEEQPVHLVSRAHVERYWDERRKGWFERYACPLTEEVWSIWDPNPEKWRPLNHSCDPNCWLEGLDVVARRSIRPGEEITLDYAGMCNEQMPAFECFCESPSCRGTIRGTDFLEPFLDGYGQHVSDYILRRRAGRT